MGSKPGDSGHSFCRHTVKRLGSIDNTPQRIAKEKAYNSDGENLDTEAKHEFVLVK